MDVEQLFHLIDLLSMHTHKTQTSVRLGKKNKENIIAFDKKLIKKLNKKLKRRLGC